MAVQDWVREYEELTRLTDSAKSDITKMINYENNKDREAMNRVKRDAKIKLKQVGERLPNLQSQLEKEINDPYHTIQEGEIKRRTKDLKKLGKDYNQCKKELEDSSSGKNNFSSDYVAQEDSSTIQLSNEQLLQKQKMKEKEYEEDLDVILKGVKKVNEISYDINVEVDRQGKVLDDIDHEMDRAQNKIETNTKRVDILTKKSKDTGCCCLMLLLFLVIVALLIPY